MNTWDRQPYWTLSGVDDGFADPAGRSFIRAWDTNQHNMMLNGYNGVCVGGRGTRECRCMPGV